MARDFIFRMVIASVNKKGFTLLEMLMSLLVMTSLSVLGLGLTNKANYDHYYFMSDFALKQAETLLKREKIYLEHNVSLNSMGRVDLARSIYIGNHKGIVHLGNGYLTYE